MTDIIKKAVELADGWEVKPSGAYHSPFCEDHFDLAPELITQPHLDALAAQLVRQVDATDTHTITVYGNCSAVIGSGDWIEAKDSDRTMNTIKAIVDSGVLE